MKRTAFRLTLALAAIAMTSAAARAQTQADRSDVRRAVRDYVDGFYDGDTAKLVRSVRPEVYKYGFWRQRDSASYVGEQMKYGEFLSYARRVKQSNRPAPATAPRKIEVYDVQNMTASAKLTASWGTDYLLLGKYDGRWMISHVLWQSPPKPPSKPKP